MVCSNLGAGEVLPLIMFLVVRKELIDRYVDQEVVGRIFLPSRGVTVRIDTMMMIDIFQLDLTSWMAIFLR